MELNFFFWGQSTQLSMETGWFADKPARGQSVCGMVNSRTCQFAVIYRNFLWSLKISGTSGVYWAPLKCIGIDTTEYRHITNHVLIQIYYIEHKGSWHTLQEQVFTDVHFLIRVTIDIGNCETYVKVWTSTIMAQTCNEGGSRACLGCCYSGLAVAEAQAARNNCVPRGDYGSKQHIKSLHFLNCVFAQDYCFYSLNTKIALENR